MPEQTASQVCSAFIMRERYIIRFTITKWEKGYSLVLWEEKKSEANYVMFLPELKDLEIERDAVVIPDEESISSFYKIRQQLKKLGNDMLVSFINIIYC